MPIVRSFMCADCAYQMTVTLTPDQWDDPAPPCPECERRMAQEFVPVAIGGSARSKAEKITDDILEKDYHVGNIHRDRHEGGVPKVSYQDQGRPLDAATWGAARETLEGAIASGRQSRLKYGSGLDILQKNLKSGAEPDLIEASKRRAMKVW